MSSSSADVVNVQDEKLRRDPKVFRFLKKTFVTLKRHNDKKRARRARRGDDKSRQVDDGTEGATTTTIAQNIISQVQDITANATQQVQQFAMMVTERIQNIINDLQSMLNINIPQSAVRAGVVAGVLALIFNTKVSYRLTSLLPLVRTADERGRRNAFGLVLHSVVIGVLTTVVLSAVKQEQIDNVITQVQTLITNITQNGGGGGNGTTTPAITTNNTTTITEDIDPKISNNRRNSNRRWRTRSLNR